MTREEIMQLEGKELNRAVAEHVMGYTVYHYDKDYEENCYFMLMDSEYDPVNPYDGRRKTEDEAWEDASDFSGSIAAAWEVVEKLRESHTIFSMARKWGEWEAVFVPVMKNYGKAAYSCDSAPLAICRAALLATMEETP